MIIENRIEGSKKTVLISGRLDSVSAPELENHLNELLSDTELLVLDLKNLEYISSAGLRVILGVNKKMTGNRRCVIINVRDAVMEIFEVTGFVDILTIE